MTRPLLQIFCWLLPALLWDVAIAEKVPKAVQAEIDEILKRHSMPGGIAAVVENGRASLKVASGFRKQGDSRPFTVHDKVHIGSCIKAMTATLVGILVDDGRLTWDTRIADVFPEFAEQLHEDYRSVTISQLLSHYAGVPANVKWSTLGSGDSLPQQRMAMMRQVFCQKPDHPPGKTYLYSNVGFVAAGAMLEKITGESWEDLITTRLFQPLGIKSAGFGPPSVDGDLDQPWGHVIKEGQQSPVQSDNPPVLGPAGTVHLTVDDWSRFASLHVGTFKQKKSLLAPQTLVHLQTPLHEFESQIVPESNPYGFGWISTERPWGAGRVLTHTGSNTTWFATIWMAPHKKSAFIAVVNSGAPDAGKACDEMAASMIRHWAGKTGR